MDGPLIENIWKWVTRSLRVGAWGCAENPSEFQRSFSLETLEPRLFLSADQPLSDVMSLPPDPPNRYEAVCEAELLDDIQDVSQDVLVSRNSVTVQGSGSDLSEATTLTVAAQAETPTELVIVDSGVRDYRTLLEGQAIRPGGSPQRNVLVVDGGLAGAVSPGGLTTNVNMGGITFNTEISNQMTEDEFTFKVIEVIRGLV